MGTLLIQENHYRRLGIAWQIEKPSWLFSVAKPSIYDRLYEKPLRQQLMPRPSHRQHPSQGFLPRPKTQFGLCPYPLASPSTCDRHSDHQHPHRAYQGWRWHILEDSPWPNGLRPLHLVIQVPFSCHTRACSMRALSW